MNLQNLSDEQLKIAEKVIEEAERQGVNPDFALSVAFAESTFNPAAVSPKGAMGVMQLMPGTAKDLGVNPEDPIENIRGGVTYLKRLADQFDNDPGKVLAAYNAGPNSAFFRTNNLEDLPTETVNYISRIMDYSGGKFPSVTLGATPEESDEGVIQAFPNAFSTPPAPPVDRSVEGARYLGQLGGGALGTAIAGLRGGRDVMGSIGRAVAGGSQMSPQARAMMQPAPLSRAGMTPGQKWASKVVQTPGFQATPDDYSVKQAAERYQKAMPQGKVSGPAAKRYGINAPLDIGRQMPVTPPRPGPLDRVTQLFSGMAQSGPARAMKAVPTGLARYAAPPLGLAASLGEVMGASKELEKEKPDYMDVGLSGLSALGGMMSLYPPTAPIGVPLSLVPSAVRYFRDRPPEEHPSLGLNMP
jgi:hypothetical protein